jgi:hypothetical protein
MDQPDERVGISTHFENGMVPYIPAWGNVYGNKHGDAFDIPIGRFSGVNPGISLITTYVQAMKQHIDCIEKGDSLGGASWFSIASHMKDAPKYVTRVE